MEQQSQKTTVQTVKSLFLSDIHLGLCSSAADKIAAFLDKYSFSNLFIIGDFIDIYAMELFPSWPARNTELLKKIIQISTSTNVIYVIGNHDGALSAIEGIKISGIKIVNEYDYYSNLKHYWITHGHSFDKLVNNKVKLATFGSWVFNFLLWLGPIVKLFNRKPFSLAGELDKQMNERIVAGFKEHLITKSRQLGYDAVIAGHIHLPEVDDKAGYYNAGDCVYTMSCIIEDLDGKFSLVYF